MSYDNVKVNKKSWTTDEDAKLLKLIEEFGVSGSWTMISSRMGDRSGKQCRERYHNHLKSDINKTPFTKEEDDLVNELQLKLGNQWAKISKYFVGRSDNAVKNRWHIINRNKPEPTAAPVVVARKPFVPTLNFQNVMTHNVVNDLSNSMDMLNMYHSHCEHSHEPTLSTRSVAVPSSGRRADSDATIAWRCTVSLNDASDSDSDDWIEDILSSSFSSECSDDDWNSSDESDLDFNVNGDVFDNMMKISPRLEEAVQVIYDAFSEAALTQREDPAEFEFSSEYLDDLSDDITDLFHCEDGIISVKPSPVAVKPTFKKFNECLPRLTPRSPAFPVGNLKRQRGVQPGGSPVIRF